MRFRNSAFLALSCLTGLLSACGSGQPHSSSSPSPKQPPKLGSYRSLDNCDGLKDYLENYRQQQVQWSDEGSVLVDPVFGSAGEDDVGALPPLPQEQPGPGGGNTNGGTEDAGDNNVTQSDLAFPDMNRGLLYTLSDSSMKIFRVDPSTQTAQIADVDLPFMPREVITLQTEEKNYAVVFGSACIFCETNEATDIAVVDVSDPVQAAVVYHERMSGRFLEARAFKSQETVVWVVASALEVPVETSTTSPLDLLPQKEVNGQTQPVTSCNTVQVYENDEAPEELPGSLTGLSVSRLVFDAGQPKVSSQLLLSPSLRTVLAASPQHFFVAQEMGWNWIEGTSTELYQFEVARETGLQLSAIGSIPGTLRNQFFIDERNGLLRVFYHGDGNSNCSNKEGEDIPCTEPAAQNQWGNHFSLYQQEGKNLAVKSHIGPFEIDETPFSARFMDHLACIVTFREIDPLTCFDLYDPLHPSILGKLEIPGVSYHLEAITPQLLLGIGNDGSGNVVANLFDIGDPLHPQLAHQLALSSPVEWSWSPAFDDYRAIAQDKEHLQFGVPVFNSWDFFTFFSVDVENKELILQGTIDGPLAYQRAFFFGETLAVLSSEELEVRLRANLNEIFSAPLF